MVLLLLWRLLPCLTEEVSQPEADHDGLGHGVEQNVLDLEA